MLTHAPSDLAALVGHTPLVRLRAFEPRPGVEIYAKLESRNPGGSVKDRPALAMILEAERTGALRPGKILLDATSGNTGIAYAMLAASRGYDVRLCVPANVTEERKRILALYGASLVYTDPMDGSDGAIREARRRFAEDPDQYFYADQLQQPKQLARALSDDWCGADRADRRSADPFRRRVGYDRHVRRHGAPASRMAAVDVSDFRPARLAAPRPRGSQAHADGDRARDLRRLPRRHRDDGTDRRRLCTPDAPRSRRKASSPGRRVARPSPRRFASARRSTAASSPRSFRTAAIAISPSASGRRVGGRRPRYGCRAPR